MKKQASLSEYFQGTGSEGYNYTPDNEGVKNPPTNGTNVPVKKGDLDHLAGILMRYCPKFDSCSAAKCPFDPASSERAYFEGDPACALSKAKRHRAWESMPEDLKKVLRFQGYFESEYNRIAAARRR